MYGNAIKRMVSMGGASFIVLAAGALGAAEAETIVVPNGFECTEGGAASSAEWPSTGKRYQIVIAASQFESLEGRGPMWITAMAYRPDGAESGARQVVFQQYTLRLSTTEKEPCAPGDPDWDKCLDNTFDLNHGPDETIVYEGKRTLNMTIERDPRCVAGGPKAFAPPIVFQTPFTYEYREGNNLLVEVAYPPVQGSLATDWQVIGSTMLLWCGNPRSDRACWTEGVDPRQSGAPVLQFTFEPAGIAFLRGDCNGDGTTNISDPVAALGCMFLGKPTTCEDALDIDDNGVLELGDPICLLNYLFVSGSAPAAPFPGCGIDPADADDALGCERHDACP